MVEFGLKLIDNKVSEWSNYYIDYEALQQLLKKAADAKKKVEELEARNPELAAKIIAAATDDEKKHPIIETASSQQATEEHPTCSMEGSISIQPEKASTGIELQHKESGSSNQSLTKTNSFNSLSQWTYNTLFAQTQSGFIDKLRSAFFKASKAKMMFDERLYEELSKVDAFYMEKLLELKEHLRVLVEDSKTAEPKPPSGDIHVNNSGGTPRHRKLSSLTQAIEKWYNLLQPNTASVAVGQQNQQRHLRHTTETSYGSVQYGSLTVNDSDDENDSSRHSHSKTASFRPGEAESIKRALADLYRWAKLLENYSILNYTGFIKIIKRHDKNFPSQKDKFRNIFTAIPPTYKFSNPIDAEKLCERMEFIYAQWFCKGNRREAAVRILPKKGDGLDMDWSQLRLGFRLGMCTILVLWVCWDCVWGLVAQGQSTIGGRAAFPVFRACGGLLLWHWCWAISVYIWSRYRVNYIYLFDFDPRLVETPVTIFSHCVDESLVFLICMLLYYKAGVKDIPQLLPPGAYPFMLIIYSIKTLVVPWKTRGKLWKGIFQVISSPINSPTFFNIYIGDVFTSMVKVFQDVCWSLCFVLSGDFSLAEITEGRLRNWQVSFWYKNVLIPIVCLLPLWFRFCQCLRRYMDTGSRWPHLANAFKYALSQTVTLFGAFHPLYMLTTHSQETTNLFQGFWLLLFVSSSLYSFFWDIYMDWGLGRPKYGFLGPRLMYPSKYHYYGVMSADFFLRFMWVLTLVPPQSGARFELPNYMAAVQMSVELFRRMLWGSFRLEQEHRANTEGYRRVDFVPLHFTTGHDNKYKNLEEVQGRRVLTEVLLVVMIVVFISVTSAITAVKSAKEYQHEP